MIIHFDHALNSALDKAGSRLDEGIDGLLDEEAIGSGDNFLADLFCLRQKEITLVSPNHEGIWLFKGKPKQVQKRILALVNRAVKKEKEENE